VGGATASQFDKILDQGALAVARGSTEASASETNHPANAAMRRADEAYSKGDNIAAAAAYGEAIALAPDGWESYTRAVDSRLYALQRLDSTEAQIRLAEEALPKVAHSPTLASVGSGGLSAAISLPPTDARRTKLIQKFEAASAQALHDSTLQLAGDDRAALYDALVSAREDRRDSLGARALREDWAAFLVDQIHRARSPEQRTSFDPHIVGLYLEMGTPEKALPFLQQSEKEFPQDYNPPARQAVAYKAMKDWKNALAASDRAMALAYGPRKLGIYTTRVDIFLGMGNTEGARHTLEEAIRFAEALPEGQRSENRIAAFKKKLAGLQQPTGSAR
jgi:tetratricopeptide (TPR) repeat protein